MDAGIDDAAVNANSQVDLVRVSLGDPQSPIDERSHPPGGQQSEPRFERANALLPAY
jgi:hypothetical protein